VAVAAARPVGRIRVRANAGGGVAGAGYVALIARRAGDWVPADAAAALTGVGLRARVAVAAARAVGRIGVRADAGGRVAGAGHMALIARRADDRIRSCAGPALPRLGLGARVAVVAARPVGGIRVRADAGGRVAGA